MIRFSRDEDYSIIFISHLAKYYKKRMVTLSEVSRSHNISIAYLRDIASVLVGANIIGVRKSGRYYLLQNSNKLKIGDLVSVFSKKAAITCCNKSICDKREFCDSVNEWKRLNDNVFRQIALLTVNDFVQYQRC